MSWVWCAYFLQICLLMLSFTFSATCRILFMLRYNYSSRQLYKFWRAYNHIFVHVKRSCGLFHFNALAAFLFRVYLLTLVLKYAFINAITTPDIIFYALRVNEIIWILVEPVSNLTVLKYQELLTATLLICSTTIKRMFLLNSVK